MKKMFLRLRPFGVLVCFSALFIVGSSLAGLNMPALLADIVNNGVAAGDSAYVGRTGLKMLGVHSEEAAIVGDRMDTDIVAGIESGLDTVLVLSGVSTRETVEQFPYRPRVILSGVGEIPG